MFGLTPVCQINTFLSLVNKLSPSFLYLEISMQFHLIKPEWLKSGISVTGRDAVYDFPKKISFFNEVIPSSL